VGTCGCRFFPNHIAVHTWRGRGAFDRRQRIGRDGDSPRSLETVIAAIAKNASVKTRREQSAMSESSDQAERKQGIQQTADRSLRE